MKHAPTYIRLFLVLFAAAVVSCSDESETLLDPGGGGDVDTIPQPQIDVDPPVRTRGLSLILNRANSWAIFEWTAPRDDTSDEPVTRYEIRFSYTRGFEPPNFWDLSTPVSDPPTPTAPGTIQRYMFEDIEIAKDLWVGIRSYDEAGNRSPNSSLEWIHVPGLSFVGRCYDALTGNPIEGLDVQLSAGPVYPLTTDANGEFSQDDIFPGTLHFEIKSGSAAGLYHRLNLSVILDEDGSRSFVMIPFQEPVSPRFENITLLEVFKFITGTDRNTNTVLRKWHQYPIPLYVPPYVNADGVDYQLETKKAAQRWMDKTGAQTFTFVDSEPEMGIRVWFRPRADITPLVAITRHNPGPDKHPFKDVIEIVNDIPDANVTYRIMLHELGHTISFAHFDYSEFIMFWGQPLPQDISDDETALAILHAALPKRIDMEMYDVNFPRPPHAARSTQRPNTAPSCDKRRRLLASPPEYPPSPPADATTR